MKSKTLGIAAFALFIGVSDASSNVSRTVSITVNEKTKTTSPCSKYQTNAVSFRAHGVGCARHLNTAKVKAHMNANDELSITIGNWFKAFIEEYVNSVGGNAEDYIRILEEKEGRNLIEKQISKAIIVCNKVEDADDGMYTVSLVIEIRRKNVFEALDELLSTEKKWENIYNQQKAKTLYKQEIEKLKKQNK